MAFWKRFQEVIARYAGSIPDISIPPRIREAIGLVLAAVLLVLAAVTAYEKLYGPMAFEVQSLQQQIEQYANMIRSQYDAPARLRTAQLRLENLSEQESMLREHFPADLGSDTLITRISLAAFMSEVQVEAIHFGTAQSLSPAPHSEDAEMTDPGASASEDGVAGEDAGIPEDGTDVPPFPRRPTYESLNHKDVTVRVRGSYAGLINFLYDLEHSGLPMEVNSLTIEGGEDAENILLTVFVTFYAW